MKKTATLLKGFKANTLCKKNYLLFTTKVLNYLTNLGIAILATGLASIRMPSITTVETATTLICAGGASIVASLVVQVTRYAYLKKHCTQSIPVLKS